MQGRQQAAEHIEKRVRRGEQHPNWRGDAVKPQTGRSRAKRLYPNLGPCENCGKAAVERHHRDGNTLNNDPGNVGFLCRPCHLTEHDFSDLASRNRKRITADERREYQRNYMRRWRAANAEKRSKANV